MNPEIPENKRRELLELIGQGRKIDAIKIYREVTGLGLKESKDAVEAMEVGPRDLLERDLTNSRPDREGRTNEVSALSAAEQASVVESLRQGRKIEAIKRYMDATGLGLKESKDAVEAMPTSGPAPESRLPRPHFDPFDQKNRGCFGIVAMLCAAVLFVVIIGALR